MAKLYDKRLTDTIDFIETKAQLPRNAAYRKDAANACRQWMQAAPQGLQQQVSELISQGWTTDGEVARNYRRALGLLHWIGDSVQWNNYAVKSQATMASNQTAAKSAKAVRGANFSDQLDAAVESFLGATGNQSFLDTKFHELKSTPLAFLNANRLKISGSKSGPQTYKFFQYIDSGNLVTYGLQSDQKTDTKYSRTVEVINVPASSFRDTKQKKDGLKGLDNIIGTEVTATGNRVFMTTTQFTGCSFCMQETDTGLVAAHMDPEEVVKKTNITGPEVRRELLQGFGFDASSVKGKLQGRPEVYGCKEMGEGGWGYEQANRKYMTIVGVYLADGWHLFTQFNATDGSFRATQIFPRT
jgi:hypothetical protein